MKYVLTVLFLFMSGTVYSQTVSIQTTPPLSEESAESAGMSDERLARIDLMLTEAVEEEKIPGAVALVARNGKIVFHQAFGTADHETGRVFQPDDIFRIASQTKAITSTAVMMLWEEARFRLDDPICRFIPEFEDAKIIDTFSADDTTYTAIPAKNPISIRHLLTHTSGIGYGIIDSDERFRKIYKKAGITDLFTTKDLSIGENVRKLASLPLHHEPGEEYTYSEGLDVLGYLVEVLSGMPLDEFFRTRIFEPLEMEDTWFYLPESKQDRLVPVLTKQEGEWTRYISEYYDPDYPVKGAGRFYSGGAGLSSTVKDYAAFLQMYLNQGELNGVRLLSRTTIQLMMSNQIGDLPMGEGQYHGLAFGVIDQRGEDIGGRGSQGSFHWGGYFNTQYFADPEENLIGVLMKQTRNISSDDTGWKFRQLAGQAVDD